MSNRPHNNARRHLGKPPRRTKGAPAIDQIRQALDGMADELGGGYTFRVTVQDQHEAHSLELPDGW